MYFFVADSFEFKSSLFSGNYGMIFGFKDYKGPWSIIKVQISDDILNYLKIIKVQ